MMDDVGSTSAYYRGHSDCRGWAWELGGGGQQGGLVGAQDNHKSGKPKTFQLLPLRPTALPDELMSVA